MVVIREAMRERVVLAAVGHPELIAEYRRYVEGIFGPPRKLDLRMAMIEMQPLAALDLAGQKAYLLAQLKAALQQDLNKEKGSEQPIAETIKLMGREAAPLLPDLEAANAKMGTVAWQSALDHLKALNH
jgi:hypothetical protein